MMGRTLESARKRLLVLLGAGSTIHAGAPSTKEITEQVCAISDDPIRSIVAGLSKQRGNDGFNFETVLACLEELDEFKIRQTSPEVWVGGVLSAFVDFRPDLVALKESSFLAAHWSLINDVSEFVTKRTAGSPRVHSRKFNTSNRRCKRSSRGSLVVRRLDPFLRAANLDHCLLLICGTDAGMAAVSCGNPQSAAGVGG
jgi:hypothetical protein